MLFSILRDFLRGHYYSGPCFTVELNNKMKQFAHEAAVSTRSVEIAHLGSLTWGPDQYSIQSRALGGVRQNISVALSGRREELVRNGPLCRVSRFPRMVCNNPKQHGTKERGHDLRGINKDDITTRNQRHLFSFKERL